MNSNVVLHALITETSISDRERWHVTEVTVETETGASFEFPCNAWVNNSDGNDVNGTTFSCANTRGRAVSLASLTPVKYEVVVVTADEKST